MGKDKRKRDSIIDDDIDDNIDDNSAFKLCEIKLKIALSPVNMSFPLDAIKEQLNNMLFKYNSEVGGIPISYSSIKLPQGKEYGCIYGERPWIHIEVTTKLLIFQPVVGIIMKGKINKVADSHVSLLVNGMFNASISGDVMRKKYVFNNTTKSWEGDGDLVEGDVISFKVGHIQHSQGVLNIDGLLS